MRKTHPACRKSDGLLGRAAQAGAAGTRRKQTSNIEPPNPGLLCAGVLILDFVSELAFRSNSTVTHRAAGPWAPSVPVLIVDTFAARGRWFSRRHIRCWMN